MLRWLLFCVLFMHHGPVNSFSTREGPYHECAGCGRRTFAR